MTLILEDGIGRRDANAYSDVDFSKEYATARGRTQFDSLSDAQIEQLAIRATDYIEQRWSEEFAGQRKTTFQGLSFPRIYLYDREGNLITGLPVGICQATVELMLRASALDRLLPDPPAPFSTQDSSGTTTDTTTGEVHSETKQVGPIRTSTTYTHSGLQSQSIITHSHIAGSSNREFPQVNLLIRPFLIGGGGSSNQTIRN